MVQVRGVAPLQGNREEGVSSYTVPSHAAGYPSDRSEQQRTDEHPNYTANAKDPEIDRLADALAGLLESSWRRRAQENDHVRAA
jgi:hypothetical protein